MSRPVDESKLPTDPAERERVLSRARTRGSARVAYPPGLIRGILPDVDPTARERAFFRARLRADVGRTGVALLDQVETFDALRRRGAFDALVAQLRTSVDDASAREIGLDQFSSRV